MEKDISYSLAITNQRRNGGCLEPTYRQVRLSCRGMAMPARAAICKELKDKDTANWYNERPDCLSILIFLPVVLSGYWITWKMRELAEKRRFVDGTIDSWLIWETDRRQEVIDRLQIRRVPCF